MCMYIPAMYMHMYVYMYLYAVHHPQKDTMSCPSVLCAHLYCNSSCLDLNLNSKCSFCIHVPYHEQLGECFHVLYMMKRLRNIFIELKRLRKRLRNIFIEL